MALERKKMKEKERFPVGGTREYHSMESDCIGNFLASPVLLVFFVLVLCLDEVTRKRYSFKCHLHRCPTLKP